MNGFGRRCGIVDDGRDPWPPPWSPVAGSRPAPARHRERLGNLLPKGTLSSARPSLPGFCRPVAKYRRAPCGVPSSATVGVVTMGTRRPYPRIRGCRATPGTAWETDRSHPPRPLPGTSARERPWETPRNLRCSILFHRLARPPPGRGSDRGPHLPGPVPPCMSLYTCSENFDVPQASHVRTVLTIAFGASAGDPVARRATHGGSGRRGVVGKLVVGRVLLQQVIDDHEDRVRDRDRGTLLAATARDPAELLRQVRLPWRGTPPMPPGPTPSSASVLPGVVRPVRRLPALS